MRNLFRAVAGAALSLALTGCFLLPGQFGSTLDLRKGGAFSFTYTGEILFQSPDKMGKKAVWNVKGAHCYKDRESEPYYNEYESVTETASAATEGPMTAAKAAQDAVDAATEAAADETNSRPCNATEIAQLKKVWDGEQATKAAKDAKDAEQFAQVFGFNPSDDASMQKFAVQLTKQAGWKSATYAGKGKFNVDYAITGRLDHDFVFPIIGESQMMMPFVMLQRRADGSVLVSAPAYSTGTLAALGSGLGGVLGSSGINENKPDQPGSAKGQFSLTTNGEILTNNTAEGPVITGKDRKLVWEVGAIKDAPPRALIMVK
jgi:hypothetical protein